MSKTAIYIPSYKNRFDEVFNYLSEIKNYDIYIILSEDDDNINNYYTKFNFGDNVHLVPTSYNTIGEKRQYIMDDAYNRNYDYVIQLDDDIRDYGYRITEETKRKTSNSYAREKISLLTLIETLIDYINNNECSYVSPMFPFSLGFSSPGRRNINKNINFGQCTLFKVKDFKESGIKYDIRKFVHEDIDVVIQLLQHGKKCVTLGDYAFEVVPNSSDLSSSVVAKNSALDLCRIRLYLKYRDGISLRIGKRGELRLTCKLNNYWNNFDIPIKNDEYHKKMYELCLEENIEEIKNLINSKK